MSSNGPAGQRVSRRFWFFPPGAKAAADGIQRTVPLHLVVFSKDRACQLDSLLQGVRDHLSPVSTIHVLYRCSTDGYARAYEKLKSRAIVDGIQWLAEKDFRGDLITLCDSFEDHASVMFLVDDDVIFRSCDLGGILQAFSEKHLFISLRASRGYARDLAPSFSKTEPFLEWRWNYHRRKPVTWNYPFSVDGNIFHARHVKRILRRISFKAPNSFEGQMHSYRHAWWIKRIGYALALPAPVVFNNPLNRVQVEGETWHGDVSPEYLNRQYLDGMRISNRKLYSVEPQAIHYAAEIAFEADG